MIIALVILHVITSLFLILVVLVQQGKGADLAGAFGGGGSQTAFGARGATTLLHKLTTGFFVLFVITSMALAVLQAHLHEGDALELRAVVVGIQRRAGLLGGGHDRLVERVSRIVERDAQGPVGTVVGVGAAREALGPLEEGQDVVPRPAVVAEVGPVVVVGPGAADVDHPVQRARAAEHLAARPVQPSPGGVGLRSREVAPVLRAAPELEDAARLVDGRVRVGPAGLH